MSVTANLSNLEAAELAYERVKAESEALEPAELSIVNLDVVSAASIVLGVAERILPYRDRMAALKEFDARNVDNLLDYATAAWYVYVTELPTPEPAEAAALIEEVKTLRDKLLLWAEPLAASGEFDPEAVRKIKEGSSNKDVPSDLVALVGLYRGSWDRVRNASLVTNADLTRGAFDRPRSVRADQPQRESGAPRVARQLAAHPPQLDAGGPRLQPVPSRAPLLARRRRARRQHRPEPTPQSR